MSEGVIFMKFVDYFENWLIVYKKPSISKLTYDRLEYLLTYFKNIMPDIEIENINKEMWQNVITDYGASRSKATVKSMNYTSSECFECAIDDGIIFRNPTRRIKIIGAPSQQKRKFYLHINQIRKLLHGLKFDGKHSHMLHYMIYLLLSTGLRYAEALAITPIDIDLDNLLIDINKAYDYKTSELENRFCQTKTPRAIRQIAIDINTGILLKKFIKKHNIPNDEPIFPYAWSKGKHHPKMQPHTINYQLKVLCKECQIPYVSCHSLRHCHASLLFAKNINILGISKRLGHTDTTTTQRTYIHLLKESDFEEIEKIVNVMTEFLDENNETLFDNSVHN